MTDPIRIHTSARIAVADPHAIEWRASDDMFPRHAFPTTDGFRWSLCGTVRFTAAYGRHGSGACVDCLAALREQIRTASAAVLAADAEELAAGDHHVGVGR